MKLATSVETQRFLESIWYRWCQQIVQKIQVLYNLTPEQYQALDDALLKPNEFTLTIQKPIVSRF